jgi:hypothetical protein
MNGVFLDFDFMSFFSNCHSSFIEKILKLAILPFWMGGKGLFTIFRGFTENNATNCSTLIFVFNIVFDRQMPFQVLLFQILHIQILNPLPQFPMEYVEKRWHQLCHQLRRLLMPFDLDCS